MGGDRRLIELAVSSPKEAVIISPVCVSDVQLLLLLSHSRVVRLEREKEMGFQHYSGFVCRVPGINAAGLFATTKHHNTGLREQHTTALLLH